MSKIYYYINKEKGRLQRTSIEKDEKFIFLGDEYSRNVLISAKVIKWYLCDDHHIIRLLEDQYGRLFYNSWFEDFNFGGGPDFVDETFNLVKDEEEADSMFDGKYSIFRGNGHIPYVYMSEDDSFYAIENVDDELEISQK
ncbi:MAG: hypothetical protein M0P58_10385 [Bacteroidales bacterium]|nr:hypothetical protein [Bacteroidales bacterium]